MDSQRPDVQGAGATEDRDHAAFQIFLNYRRQDADTAVGRLWDTLTRGLGDEEGFPEAQLFKDIDTIEPGVDFRVAIRDAVASSDVFLAVIGRDWLTAVDAKGRRRLDNPADFVRMEIEAALQRAEERDDVRVVPTLVQGAEMPAVDELPESLAPLAHRNAVELTDARWPYDAGRLLARLKELEREKRARAAEEREALALDQVRRAAAEEAEREAHERRIRGRKKQQADTWEPDEISGTTRERVDQAPPPTPPPHVRSRRTRLVGAAVASVAAGVVALAALTLRTPDAPTPPEEPDATWAHAGLPPEVVSLKGVAAAPGGEAVAVGGGKNRPRVLVSDDGSQWSGESVEGGNGGLHAVAASRDTVVAGGVVHDDQDEDGEIWKREGGRWKRVCFDACAETSVAEPARQAINSLTSTPSGGFVAVGVDGTSAAVWTSSDGSTWSRAARGGEALRGAAGNASVMNGVTAVGDRLVAVGRRRYSGAVWWSDDAGASWRVAGGVPASAEGEQIVLTAVAASGTGSSTAVAVGYRQRITGGHEAAVAWISTDGGSTWTDTDVADATPRGQKLDGVVRAGTSWLAVGQDRPDGPAGPVVAAVWQSTDGVAWEAVDNASFAGEGDRSMAATAVVAGRTLAVGSGIWAAGAH